MAASAFSPSGRVGAGAVVGSDGGALLVGVSSVIGSIAGKSERMKREHAASSGAAREAKRRLELELRAVVDEAVKNDSRHSS
jgi:hypothetical protein